MALAVLPAAATADGAVTHVDPPSTRDAFSYNLMAKSAGGPSIPDKWCGDVGVIDDLEHEFRPADGPKIKAAIVYDLEQPFQQKHADLAQNHARLIFEHLRAESGGRKSLRFDLGTSCGPGHLDLAVIRAAPAGPGSTCPNTEEYKTAMNPRKRPFNLLTISFVTGCTGGGGFGETGIDDQPGPENEANTPGRLAMNLGNPDPYVSLHEIAHTLGAVQPTALHTDGYFHCWDLADVMCYPYTSQAPQSPVRPCAFADGLDPFDCNKDDYFNPDPAPGSYLDTHWNLFNSVFMCPVDECVPAPVVAAPVAPPAPTPVAAPAAKPSPAPKRAAAKPAAKRRVSKRCRTARTKAARRRYKCPPLKRRR